LMLSSTLHSSSLTYNYYNRGTEFSSDADQKILLSVRMR
jgi:hypothetical protein